MIIGCPKEIKHYENRVGLIPSSVRMLIGCGHTVLVEQDAGLGANISNEEFSEAGAQIVSKGGEVWRKSHMIIKVKEPLKEEYPLIQPQQIIFTFLHLAAEKALAMELLKKKVTAIAYETIEDEGELPILKPMSEIAGKMATEMGSYFLTNSYGGKGLLLSGAVGVKKAQVVVLGAGVVGKNAAKIAQGLNANVTILDINLKKLEEMEDLFQGKVQTVYSTPSNIAYWVQRADLLIGAVLVNGDKAPVLVHKDMLKTMERGSVIVDVAIDQGGCIETIKRTYHDNPTYLVDGVLHYGVANMPGAVASTSTFALAHSVFPYLRTLAQCSQITEAFKKSTPLLKGLNTFQGYFTNQTVAKVFGGEYRPLKEIL